MYNVLAAIGASIAMGIDIKLGALKALQNVGGVLRSFCEVVNKPLDGVDCAHTPDGLARFKISKRNCHTGWRLRLICISPGMRRRQRCKLNVQKWVRLLLKTFRQNCYHKAIILVPGRSTANYY